jgi:PTH1 family peptidyl-tRNA hydrolase
LQKFDSRISHLVVGMKLIVGLGNPGAEYQYTPHNAGFLAIDRIAEVCNVAVTNRRGRAQTAKARLAGEEVLLQELELGIEDMIVLYDDLALPLGTLRIRERGSAGGHNGAKSVSGVLGTEEWKRIRIGVGKPPLETGREVKAGGTEYLLSPMTKRELAVLDEVLDEAVRAVETVLTKGVSAAMGEFNKKVSSE